MIPTFQEQKVSWSNPPVDDVGYISSKSLLKKSNEELRALTGRMEAARYDGWRNYNGNWRRVLGLDDTKGQRVLDYGCGVGVEALQYARRDNAIWLADIVEENLKLASRILRLFGYTPIATCLLRGRSPFYSFTEGSFDVVHCSGVLHHIPKPRPVVRQMSRWLKANGELRLMLYSDDAWRLTTNAEPPSEVETHKLFRRFVTAMDGVGEYSDWYDEERLTERFGEWFEIANCEYLTENRAYLGAVLRKR